MNRRKEHRLCHEFPNLFQDYGKDPSSTCMTWGCSISDGWFKLLYKLCKDIKAQTSHWSEEDKQKLKFVQIKEKFGSLRIYMSMCSPLVEVLIDQAERKSAKICEYCGKKGKFTNDGWIKVLCKRCELSRYKQNQRERAKFTKKEN